MIEMMVILGIVAILLLLAILTYQDKFIRDQIVEALPLAEIAKPPVAASWAALRSFPPDNAAAGLPTADRIVNKHIWRHCCPDVEWPERDNWLIGNK